jgi:hypothetical protein
MNRFMQLLIGINVFLVIMQSFGMQENGLNLNLELFKGVQADDSYKCNECEEIFRVKEKFTRHLGQLHDNNIFKCTKCESEFYLESSHFLHCKNQHNLIISRKKTIACDLCKTLHTGETLFFKHVKKYHSTVKADSISKIALSAEQYNDYIYKSSVLLKESIIGLVKKKFEDWKSDTINDDVDENNMEDNSSDDESITDLINVDE